MLVVVCGLSTEKGEKAGMAWYPWPVSDRPGKAAATVWAAIGQLV